MRERKNYMENNLYIKKDDNLQNEGLINLLKYANINVNSIKEAKELFFKMEEDIKKNLFDRFGNGGKVNLRNLIISTNNPECIKSFFEDERFRLVWHGCKLFNRSNKK